MYFDDSIRVPVSREMKKDFQQACRFANSKSMTTVSRDLFAAFVKGIRKAAVFPGNYEAPNYEEVVDIASGKEGVRKSGYPANRHLVNKF